MRSIAIECIIDKRTCPGVDLPVQVVRAASLSRELDQGSHPRHCQWRSIAAARRKPLGPTAIVLVFHLDRTLLSNPTCRWATTKACRRSPLEDDNGPSLALIQVGQCQAVARVNASHNMRCAIRPTVCWKVAQT